MVSKVPTECAINSLSEPCSCHFSKSHWWRNFAWLEQGISLPWRPSTLRTRLCNPYSCWRVLTHMSSPKEVNGSGGVWVPISVGKCYTTGALTAALCPSLGGCSAWMEDKRCLPLLSTPLCSYTEANNNLHLFTPWAPHQSRADSRVPLEKGTRFSCRNWLYVALFN